MTSFTDIVQKAFYLGIGIASYAGEKANSTFGELREQAQELVDELVSRGEMTAEEARRWVEDVTNQAANQPSVNSQSAEPPRRIEIFTEDERLDQTPPDELPPQ